MDYIHGMQHFIGGSNDNGQDMALPKHQRGVTSLTRTSPLLFIPLKPLG